MSGRPPLPVGTWGDISTRQVGPKLHEARARFRNPAGSVRLVSRRGPTKTAAKNRLLDHLATLAKAASPASGIVAHTRVSDLLDTWLDEKAASGAVRPQTIDDYRQTITSTITPGMGGLTVEEATPGRVSVFLKNLPPAVAVRSRTILSQAFATAVAHDAISRNPVRELPKSKEKTKDVITLQTKDLVELRRNIALWQAGKISHEGKQGDGVRGYSGRAHDLLWFVDLLLATGCRPGELLAVRWCDIDFTAERPTVLIDATMVETSAGLVRQEMTKTGEDRCLVLPPYAVQTLAVMREQQLTPIGAAPLFPGMKGGHRAPGSVRKQWRTARRAAGLGDPSRFDWVEFRTMRRTVATAIDGWTGDKDAAAQLGHSSTSMTRKHYIKAKAAQAPDLTEVLERFAG